MIETGGGPIWERVPSNAPVIGESLQDSPSAYPLLVLRRVGVVHDTIKNHPYLLVFTPVTPAEQTIGVYDLESAGPNFHLGTSGYMLDNKVLLYDHDTESLWIEGDKSLDAISGARKGKQLPLVDRPVAVTWSSWKASHPGSRLVVGSRDPEGVAALR